MIHRSLSLLVAVVACVALAAPLFSGCRTAPSLTAQESEGKQLYLSRCAHCHEENDLQLKRVPPDLHSLFAGATMPSGTPVSDAAVRAVVLHGKGMMPIFDGRFTDEQMAALLAYLRTGLR